MNDSATAKSSLDATLNALALLLDDPSAGARPRAATPETTAVALDPPAAAAPPARAWPSARVETLAHLAVLEPQARKRVAAAELAAEAAAAAARVTAEEERHRAALSTNAMRMRLANQSHTIAQQRKSNEVGVRRLQLQRAVQRASHASGKPATITEAAAPSTKRQHLGFGSMVGAASLMGGAQRRARAAAAAAVAAAAPAEFQVPAVSVTTDWITADAADATDGDAKEGRRRGGAAANEPSVSVIIMIIIYIFGSYD